MQQRLVILSAALCAQAILAAAQTGADLKQDVRRIAEPGAMLDATRSRVAACQPLRGDAVAVRSVQPQSQGLQTTAEVVVLSGRCKDKSGWIGSHRLAAATQ